MNQIIKFWLGDHFCWSLLNYKNTRSSGGRTVTSQIIFIWIQTPAAESILIREQRQFLLINNICCNLPSQFIILTRDCRLKSCYLFVYCWSLLIKQWGERLVIRYFADGESFTCLYKYQVLRRNFIFPFVLPGETLTTRRSTRTRLFTGTTAPSARCASPQKVQTRHHLFTADVWLNKSC